MGTPVNPDQLRMFMTPREIVDEYRPNDYRAYDRWLNERAMWSEKTSDAYMPGSDLDAHFVNPANGRAQAGVGGYAVW